MPLSSENERAQTSDTEHVSEQRTPEELERERELSYLDRFLKVKPLKFWGTFETDKAESWIKHIKKLHTLHVPPEYQINLATHVFEGEADTWWETICDQYKVEEMTWAQFEKHFYDRYIPLALRQAKVKEFQLLEQQFTESVAEYVSKFTELSRYAPEMIAIEESKALKFEQGLIEPIRRHIVGQSLTTYNAIVNATYRLEQDHLNSKRKQQGSASGFKGAGGKVTRKTMMKEPGSSSGFGGRRTGPLTCYHCGEIGHVRTRCPNREASGSTATTQNCPQHPANSETVQQTTNIHKEEPSVHQIKEIVVAVLDAKVTLMEGESLH
ncbi:hypothetical protein M0R45_008971 [Rubus argutus]|uniref:CCHC-type domain-containing protein n=1 Tax=Rubus argutus TaxID=59490 RepID=A0AAW1Y4M5_RUBAR